MNGGISDEDLMLRYRDGDGGAFESLYLRHKGGIYRYFLRQCRDTATAEELFQDVWMKVIGARARYTVRAKFTTWLYQMARNRLIDYYRRQAGGGYRREDCPMDPEMPAAGLHDQPQQQAEMHEQVKMLTQLIDALPAEQREAFILKEESGMNIAAIAEVTGVNAETVKSRLRYAVKKLRQGLDCGN